MIGRGENKEEISRGVGGGGWRNVSAEHENQTRLRKLRSISSQGDYHVNNLFLLKNGNVFTLAPFITAVVAAAYRQR